MRAVAATVHVNPMLPKTLSPLKVLPTSGSSGVTDRL